MTPISRLRFGLFVLAGCLAVSRAGAQGETPQPVVTVTFTVVGWSGEPAALFYQQAGRHVPFEAPPFTRSKSYRYTGPAQMDIYASGEAAGKPAPAVKAGTVVFPVGPKRFTVLLGGQNGHYMSRVIADDEEGFPVGTARVFNLTSTRMLIRYNQKNAAVILAEKNEILRPRPDFQLVAETAFERNGQWKRSNDDFIYTPPDSQTSVFYFESDSSYFKSIDGGARDIQLVVLREKPIDSGKAGIVAVQGQ